MKNIKIARYPDNTQRIYQEDPPSTQGLLNSQNALNNERRKQGKPKASQQEQTSTDYDIQDTDTSEKLSTSPDGSWGETGLGKILPPALDVPKSEQIIPDYPTMEGVIHPKDHPYMNLMGKPKHNMAPSISRNPRKYNSGPSVSKKNKGGKGGTGKSITRKEKRDYYNRAAITRHAQKISDFVEQVIASSVKIESYIPNVEAEVGAGFFVNPYIIATCAHVLKLYANVYENNQLLQNAVYKIYHNGNLYNGRVVTYDVQNDVALVYVAQGKRQPFPYLPVGDIKDITEGEVVVTIGSPFAFNDSVSYGIISNASLVGNQFLVDLRLNPGNSGGMIYSLDQRAVVGVASAILSDKTVSSEGIGVGVSINIVKDLMTRFNLPFNTSEIGADNA